MAETSILKYIEDSRVSGISDAEIRSALLKTGWPEVDVDLALKEASVAPSIASSGFANFFSSLSFPNLASIKSLSWKSIILASILFLAIAGGAFGAITYYKTPNSAFFEIGEGEVKVENFTYSLNLHLKSLEPDSKTSFEGLKKLLPANLFFAVEDGIISTTPSHNSIRGADIKLNFSGSFEDKGEAPKFSVALNSDVDAGETSFKFDGEIRAITKILYFLMNEAPETFGNKSEIAPIETGKWYSLREANFDDLGFGLSKNKAPSAEVIEFRNKLKEIPIDPKMFEIVSAERGELEDGTPIYKYKIKLRKDNLGFYLNEVFKIDVELFAEYRTDEMLENLTHALSNGEVSVSVARDSKFVREVFITTPEIIIDGEKFLGEFSLKLSGHNASPVKIPSPVIQYDPILKKSLEAERIKLRDEKRIADIAQIEISLKSYFDANKKKYPASLSASSTNMTQALPLDPLSDAPYSYFKTAKGYHVGASLEAKDNAVLLEDSDSKSGFNGADDFGCAGEKDRYCYDIAI